jgi:radical SAM superfamily enzyme YgiQ (UPF0313 family)
MMQNLVFFGANSSYSHSMLSYAMLQSFNAEKSPEWQWRQFETVTSADPMDIAIELADIEMDAVIATAYLFNITFLLRVLSRFKRLKPDIPIFLGGPEFLGDNQKFLRRNPEIAAVIRGDESSVWLLLQNLENRNLWRRVPGLCMLEDDKYYDNNVARFEGELDAMPTPYRHDLLPHGKSFVQLETSRGCTGGCTFCAGPVGHIVKQHSLTRVKSDLNNIKDAGFKEIRILDRTFNSNTGRLEQMFRLFREEFTEMNFHLEINPARLDEKQLLLIRDMPPGLLHIEAGVQSLDDKVLHTAKRPATAENTIKGLTALCQMQNFEVHADLIAGLPQQELDSILRDVVTLVRLGPDEIQLETLKILPGTPLRKHPPAKMCYSPDPPYEILRTTQMSSQDLIKARHISILLESYYNTAVLQPVFRFATLQNPAFPMQFLETASKLFSNFAARPALTARFDTLENYAQNDPVLLELIKFAHLAAAGSPAKYELKLHKTQPEMIDSSMTDAPFPKRYCEADFAWNVDELYLDPTAHPVQQAERCRFFRYQSGHPAGFIKV